MMTTMKTVEWIYLRKMKPSMQIFTNTIRMSLAIRTTGMWTMQ